MKDRGKIRVSISLTIIISFQFNCSHIWKSMYYKLCPKVPQKYVLSCSLVDTHLWPMFMQQVTFIKGNTFLHAFVPTSNSCCRNHIMNLSLVFATGLCIFLPHFHEKIIWEIVGKNKFTHLHINNIMHNYSHFFQLQPAQWLWGSKQHEGQHVYFKGR